jgi:hypothetical protein
MRRDNVVQRLLQSDNPSIRWKVRVGALGEDPASRSIAQLREQIRVGPWVRTLLSRRDDAGRIEARREHPVRALPFVVHVAALADLGYPVADDALLPLRDQVFEFWLRQQFFTEFEATSRAQAYGRSGVPVMQGRYRRCASQQGNALYSAARLGLLDGRDEPLVERLLHWQWPDGGWNCDKNPSADSSSFMETLLPMRGLALYAGQRNDAIARSAAERAAGVFLSRRLFKRRADDTVIAPAFTALHHPVYWHYDVLAGLEAMVELGLIGDPRCADALDLLEQKELAGGGWAADARYFKASAALAHGADYVDWGGAGKRTMNEWVTAGALSVLHAAGRI